MGRCNYCGSRKRPIVIISLLDGNICNLCASNYFFEVRDGRMVPRYYDRDLLMGILNNQNKVLRNNIISKIKEIKTRYIFRINHFYIDRNQIAIIMDSKIKGKNTCITLIGELRTNKAYYNKNYVGRNVNYIG